MSLDQWIEIPSEEKRTTIITHLRDRQRECLLLAEAAGAEETELRAQRGKRAKIRTGIMITGPLVWGSLFFLVPGTAFWVALALWIVATKAVPTHRTEREERLGKTANKARRLAEEFRRKAVQATLAPTTGALGQLTEEEEVSFPCLPSPAAMNAARLNTVDLDTLTAPR